MTKMQSLLAFSEGEGSFFGFFSNSAGFAEQAIVILAINDLMEAS
jgi:hypothetical protein